MKRKRHKAKVKYGGRASWIGVAVGAAAAAGTAFGAGYMKSPTWSLDFPSVPLLMVAVGVAAAGGAAAGLAKAVTAAELPKHSRPRG